MRKKLLLILISLFSWLASSSQIIQEDFESGFSVFINATGNTTNFKLDSSLFVSGNKSAYDSCISNAIDTLYHSSIIDLTSTTNPYLTFWHIAKLDSLDKATVLISVDSGLSYSPLPISSYKPISSSNGYNPGLYFNEMSYPQWKISEFPKQKWWKKEAFDLSTFSSFDKVKILFVLTSDSSINKKGWFIDDIIVENQLCASPYSISSFGTTKDSTNLTWLNGGNDSLWQIQYDTVNFSLGNGNFTNFLSTDTTFLNRLNGGVLYDVYLRSICRNRDTSDWLGPYTFKTNCDTLDFSLNSYYQYFNSGVSFDDICWSVASGNYGDTTPLRYGNSYWQMNDFENNPSKSISAKLNLSKVNNGQWLISPFFYLGTDPNSYACISFDIIYTDSSSQIIDTIELNDTLFIGYSTDNGITWNFKNLGYYSNNYLQFSNNNNFKTTLRNLTGTVKLALYVKKNNSISNGDLFVDNFIINYGSYKPCWWSGLTIFEKEKNNVSLFPNPSNNYTTIQLSDFSQNIELNIFSIQGQQMKRYIISKSTSQIYVGDLPKGFYIFNFSFGNGKIENHRMVVY